MATAEKAIALFKPTKNELVNSVMAKIATLQGQKRLALPPNYSPENALMSAYLQLQSIRTKGDPGEPVLQACTQESIANSLVDMVIQGLTPAKKQCYFIPYGKALTLQRSYMGTAAVAMRVMMSTRLPSAKCVFEGDQFEYEIQDGSIRIVKHLQSFANINKDKILGAYCTVYPPEGEPYTDIMTFDEIKQAWKQSQMRPFDEKGNLKPDSTHAKFTIPMALKTVIGRACKMAINTSDDSTLDLVVESVNRSDEAAEEAAFGEEVAANANADVIDVGFEEKQEEEPAPEPEAEAKTEAKEEEKQPGKPAQTQPAAPKADPRKSKAQF